MAVREGNQFEAEEFLGEFVSKNRPVLIKGLAKDWPALEKWTDKQFKYL